MNSVEMEWLMQYTFVVQHNPNCSKPYLVRMCRPTQGVMDCLPIAETRDLYAYGDRLEFAIQDLKRLHTKAKNRPG